MDLSFWKEKNVLITGHTGFKGSWLSIWLQKLGANVIGFSLDPPTKPNLFTEANVAENMISLTGDVRDFQSVHNALLKHAPEIVFHMAAQSLVRYSYDHPIETYATNVMGTVNLLEAARLSSTTKVIVNITSDKCYENKEWDWGYRESDNLGGYDPYSNSKACAELVTSAYRNSYHSSSTNCSISSVRAGNVIGGGDWAKDRLIPDLMRNILQADQFILRYPSALRPWQHVLEPLCGYLQLAEHMYKAPAQFSESWNFGPEDKDVKSVGWIVEQIKILCNRSNSEKDLLSQPKLHEAAYLKLDSSKAKNKLGWKPRWDLKQALEQTVSWYQAHNEGKDMYKKTLEQINEYVN